MVYSWLPIFFGKVSAYWASNTAPEFSTSLTVQLPGHLKYQEWGDVPESPRRCGRGRRKTDFRLQLCFPPKKTNTAIKKWNLFTRQNMVKHSCVLHPLHRFKYWPVSSVFVLVPSAHTAVHELFHSLIISPPAAGAEDEVIIQQAVQGFPSARLHSAKFPRLRHSSGGELYAQSAAKGSCSRGLCNLGSEESTKKAH